MRACSFYINWKLIENVKEFRHLGHITTSAFSDDDDVVHRRNSFVGQTNNLLFF
jgi:hypothetical protein